MISLVTNVLKNKLDPDTYIYGFACVKGLINEKLSAYTYAISILRKLDDKVIDDIANGPSPAYYDHYNDINAELNLTVARLAAELAVTGFNFYPVSATVADENLDDTYRKNLTYFVSHKMAATRAGLGWIGKTDLLVSRKFGPRVRLATILTDMKLPQLQKPINESLCGECTICVDHCPAQAANGIAWKTDIHRDVFFNPFKCREYCRKISQERLNRVISLCGKCISLCPCGRQ